MIHFLFTFLISTSDAAVKDPIYDELAGLPLVEALIHDGKLKTAEEELAHLPQSAGFWIVSGHLNFAKAQFGKAVEAYERAPATPTRSLFLARSYLRLEEFGKCRQAYGESQLLWMNSETHVTSKAICEIQSGQMSAAWESLETGWRRWQTLAVLRERIALRLKLNLDHAAESIAFENLSSLRSSEILGVSELFVHRPQKASLLKLIDYARARFPFDLDVNLTAAQVYFGIGQIRAATEAFERAALVSSKYQYHVVEFHRQMANLESATYHAQFVQDPKTRLKAKMAISVDSRRYPLIAAMESELNRNAQNSDEMHYALAFTLFQQGNFSRSLPHLKSISQADLIEKAGRLKKAISECVANDGVCRM